MFDLEQSVSAWKTRFQADTNLSTQDVAELEIHLRQSVASLRQIRDLRPDEAFLLAAHRLGPPKEIEREYRKVHGSGLARRQLFWMVSGYLSGIAFAQVVAGLSTLAACGATLMGFFGQTVGWTQLFTGMVLWSGLFAYLFWQSRLKAVPRSSFDLSRLALAGLALAAILGQGFGMVGRIVHHAYADPTSIFTASTVTAYGHLFGTLTIIAAGLVLAFALNDRQPSSAAETE